MEEKKIWFEMTDKEKEERLKEGAKRFAKDFTKVFEKMSKE